MRDRDNLQREEKLREDANTIKLEMNLKSLMDSFRIGILPTLLMSLTEAF